MNDSIYKDPQKALRELNILATQEQILEYIKNYPTQEVKELFRDGIEGLIKRQNEDKKKS